MVDLVGAGSILGGIGSIASAFGGGGDDAKQIARRNRQMQEYTAKHAIRWRVKDAKAAGIHPLYAMGVAPPSFTPTAIPGQTSTGDRLGQALDGAGRALSGYGQAKAQSQLDQLQVEEAKARIELIRAQTKATDPVQAAVGASLGKRVDQAANQIRPPPKPSAEYITLPGGKRSYLPPSSPAEAAEDEFSEPGSWPFAIARIIEWLGGNWDPALRGTPYHAKGKKWAGNKARKRKHGKGFGYIQRR